MPTNNTPSQVTESKNIVSDKEPASKQKQLSAAAVRFRGWKEKARHRLHCRFPNLILLQHKQERDYILQKDKDDNLKTRVATDEELRLRAIWGIEIFGPAEIDSLYAAFKRLGWNEGRFNDRRSTPSKWIAEQRMYGSSGSYNLGLLRRDVGQASTFLWDRLAPLPDTIEYVQGFVHQITPSITAVILCFVLCERDSTAYELVLNTDRETKNVPYKRGYSMHNVEHLKIGAIEDVRTTSKKIVTDWFEEYLPGFFSKSEDGNRLPTAELITTLREPLLTSVGNIARDQDSWVNIFKNYQFSSIWKYKDFVGLTFSWDTSDDNNRFHTLVNLQTEKLTDEHLKNRGDRGAFAYVAFVNERVEGVLVNFAVYAALREVTRTLRLTRERLSMESKNHKKVLRALNHIKSFFDKSIGLPIMTAELVNLSKTDTYHRWHCSEFLNEPWRENESPVQIAEILRSNVHSLASRAVAQEKETREHLEQISAILSIQESVRTQKRMEALTIVATILAAASLFVALMSIDPFKNFINHQAEGIFSIK